MKRFLLVLASYPAFAQIRHGSVGVVYFSDDRIAMAADSRGTFPEKFCKLIPEPGLLSLASATAGW
jgi:hypothetical protein